MAGLWISYDGFEGSEEPQSMFSRFPTWILAQFWSHHLGSRRSICSSWLSSSWSFSCLLFSRSMFFSSWKWGSKWLVTKWNLLTKFDPSFMKFLLNSILLSLLLRLECFKLCKEFLVLLFSGLKSLLIQAYYVYNTALIKLSRALCSNQDWAV